MNIIGIKFYLFATSTPEQEELKEKISSSKYKRTETGIYENGDFKWYSCASGPFRFVREYEEFGYGQPSSRYEEVIAVGDSIEELFE